MLFFSPKLHFHKLSAIYLIFTSSSEFQNNMTAPVAVWFRCRNVIIDLKNCMWRVATLKVAAYAINSFHVWQYRTRARDVLHWYKVRLPGDSFFLIDDMRFNRAAVTPTPPSRETFPRNSCRILRIGYA